MREVTGPGEQETSVHGSAWREATWMTEIRRGALNPRPPALLFRLLPQGKSLGCARSGRPVLTLRASRCW